MIEGSPSVSANNWSGVRGSNYIQLDEPWGAMPIHQQTAQEAYESVLQHAGASLPKRDPIDSRILQEVREGSATYEGVYKTKKRVGSNSEITGIIDSQEDVGGWPELENASAAPDTDHDGIPDAWETTHGMDPNDTNDGNQMNADGYTMLEQYINSIQ